MNTANQKLTRIFICGAHSVGNTTLAQSIAIETGFHLEPEAGRALIEEKGLKREDYDPKTKPEGFKKLQEMISASFTKVEDTNDLLGQCYIGDRTALDAVVYALVYLGKTEADELLRQESTKRSIRRYQSSLIFVITKPYPEYMREDNVRLPPTMEELNLFTSTLEALLRDLQIPYTLIDALDLKERIRIVKEQLVELRGVQT